MEKQAPTLLRVGAMVLFTFSCVGLLMYLWLAFGGSTPLQPKGYRFTAALPEGALLAEQADVNIAGLKVGRVTKKRLDPERKATLVEMEIDEDFAPIPKDTRAILRPKTLLGQTYVELSPGTKSGPKLGDNEILPRGQIQEEVQVDEIVRTFDAPTRRAFQGWVRELAVAIEDRGDELNAAFGTLEQFTESGSDLLTTLDEQKPVVKQLVRNAGEVTTALSERDDQFTELIVNANDFFGALASRDDALAETISILPTFLDESRATIRRLKRFSTDTRPLVRDLTPVARDLQPTIRDVRVLAPDLKALFKKLDPLIDESPKTLPRAEAFIRGTEPLFESLHTYLPELNPILSFLNYQQQQVADFFMNGTSSFGSSLPGIGDEGVRHYLKQYSIINSRSIGLASTRADHDRGNAYPLPNYLNRKPMFGINEAWDCKPSGPKKDATSGQPPCFIAPKQMYDGGMFPRLDKGEQDLKDPPKGTESTAGSSGP